MKKLITIGLIAMFAFSSLMAFEMKWGGTARVRGGIVQNAGWDKDASTTSWKSQRIRLFMTGEAENGVKFVIRSKWTNGDVGGSNFKKTVNNGVTIDRAYIVIPDAFAGFTLQAGKLPFYLKNGLIVDDNQPGMYASRMFGDIYFGFGGFTMSEDNSDVSFIADADSDSDNGTYGDGKASDDSHGWVASVSKSNVGPGTVGLDVAVQTNTKPDEFVFDATTGGCAINSNTNYSASNVFWVSPWYSLSMNDLNVTINPVFMSGSFEANDAGKAANKKDLDGSIMALSVKPSYKLGETSISADILYISGVAKDDQDENFGWRNMSSFYCQGLDWFGSANSIDNYGDVGNVVDAYGQTAVAVYADQPILSNLTAHLGLGYVMTSEDVEYGDNKKDNVLGTEIDLGVAWNVKENVTWKVTGVYVMPGDATLQGSDKDEAITALNSYLEYSF